MELKKHLLTGDSEIEVLKEVLIKNLPKEIKAGMGKTTSNINTFKTAYALTHYNFINYNSKEKISILCFDLDYIKGKKAKECFSNIFQFNNYLVAKLGEDLTPTFVIETTKGYQFFYQLQYPIFTKNKKALKYLLDIKKGITEHLELDAIASNRLYGVFRNPLLHNFYFSYYINFNLKDFSKFALNYKTKQSYNFKNFENLNLNLKNFNEGNRNYFLFIEGLKFAKNKKYLEEQFLTEYLENINSKIENKLDTKEILKISKNVYKYYIEDKIYFNLDIDIGVMGFEKMKNLTKEEYLEETKKRQKEASKRTLKIRNKEKNLNSLEKARQIKIEKNLNETIKKIKEAKEILERENKKITKVALANLTKLSRKTIIKYFKEI
ncbi:hypothetical protein ACOL22_06840 [Aliarcobacter butzleri]